MYLVIGSFIFCASPEFLNLKNGYLRNYFSTLLYVTMRKKILGESSRDDSKTITRGWWTMVSFRKNLQVLPPTPKGLVCG